ncbi:pyruvate kinase [Haloferula helveola]|uniref:Pyruvate kinase n=1 Tax=Haloferula helveola TaxID=490095 RepID=A0ABN6HCZ7_9BACT|nr:pyruvate kinase [Haloferula helveola]
MPRKTKLVVTLGPATESPETIGQLIELGANVFRLNMSHAKHEWAAEMAKLVRRESAARHTHVAVLFDLTGPSIRTGDLKEPYELKIGDLVEFRKADTEPSIPLSTTVNYPGMMDDVSEGKTLVVDNGTLLMEIRTKKDDRIICEVRNAGKLGSRRHINLPGTRLNLPAMTDKDRKDLSLAVECDADYIAGSFVRDAAHVQELRSAVEALEGNAQIISKIEDQEAVRHIDAIIQASDAIMIARGDLGIEVAFEELPILQRRIIKRCHELGRRVIVATQLLESMIQNPTPTRAEVTDCSNAVYEEADALMLSGETSIGKHPLRCVEALVKISSRIERSGGLGYGTGVLLRDERQKTARAAVTLSDSLPDARLVVLTRRGVLANHTAMLRPKTAGFYAFTPRETVCRQLALTRNIEAFKMPFAAGIDETIERAAKFLIDRGLVQPGGPMVIVSDLLSDHIAANSILLHHA